MNYAYENEGDAVAQTQAVVADRTGFLQKTYLHLFAAVAAFVGVEALIFKMGWAEPIAALLLKSWLVTLGGFMLVGWIGSYFAHKRLSKAQQYLGLGLYVVAEAFIFVPLLFVAVHYSDPTVLPYAALSTIIGFGVLTLIVTYTGVDFSFLGKFLLIAGIVALVAIVASVLFSVSLGFYFSLAMVLFAAGAILYETSKILYQYDDTQYVAAALGLFASVALLFYYVLMLLVNRE